MKIDFDSIKGTLFEWFVILSITEKNIKTGEIPSDGLDVVLTLNGVEVPIKTVFDRLQKTYDDEIENATEEGIGLGKKRAVDRLRDLILSEEGNFQ